MNTRQDFPFVYNELNDNITIQTSENIRTVSDLLQRSYINDTVLNFLIFNEVQQLVSDVWVFKDDEFMTTGKLSNLEYTKTNEDNNEVYKYKQFLLDNNIPQEHKQSTSTYILQNLKIVWKESSKLQTEVQSESNLEVTYFKNVFPNSYLIKPGDIIKDPIDPDDFWIVSQIKEEHIMYDKINKKNVIIYKLFISRQNLTTIPLQIWEYYRQAQQHFGLMTTEQEKRFLITKGSIPEQQPQELVVEDLPSEITNVPITVIDVTKEWILESKRKENN